jgi:hypothetical protein
LPLLCPVTKGTKWLTHTAYYRCRTEAFSTKIGLSIVTVIGLPSLLDELPCFRRKALEIIGSV